MRRDIRSEEAPDRAERHPAAAGSAMPKSPAELREAERVVHDWRQKIAKLGGRPPLMSLDLARMATSDWNHRFLISTDNSDGDYAFVIYGRRVARLLDLPDEPVPPVPMVQHLPERYLPVFVEGCREAAAGHGPIRRTGKFEQRDGGVELYRVVFLPVGEGSEPASLIYGAFNSRILRQPSPVGFA